MKHGTLRYVDEFGGVLVNFLNSKVAPKAALRLANVVDLLKAKKPREALLELQALTQAKRPRWNWFIDPYSAPRYLKNGKAFTPISAEDRKRFATPISEFRLGRSFTLPARGGPELFEAIEALHAIQRQGFLNRVRPCKRKGCPNRLWAKPLSKEYCCRKCFRADNASKLKFRSKRSAYMQRWRKRKRKRR